MPNGYFNFYIGWEKLRTSLDCSGIDVTMFGLLDQALRVLHIAIQLHKAEPRYLDLNHAIQHARAAVTVETRYFPAEELLSRAWLESRFQPNAAGLGVGQWPDPPNTPTIRTKYICGYLQSTVSTWDECLALRDPIYSYQIAIVQLNKWVELCKRIGSKQIVRCAHAGYGGGTAWAKRAHPKWYNAVLYKTRAMFGYKTQKHSI